MKTYTLNKKAIPTAHYDVVVLGGGAAGWTAAVSASRAGCSTAVIERFGFFGGTATAGTVVPLSGLFFKGKQVVHGIPWEFTEKLIGMNGAKLELPKGHLSFDPETYKLCAQRMVVDAGVDVYMNSYLSGCFSQDGCRVDAVSIENKNGTEVIEGDCFIDATGDADLFHLMGLPMLPKDSLMQPASLCFVLDGVNTDTDLLRDFIHHDGVAQKNSRNTEISRFLTKLFNEGKSPLFGGPWFNAMITGPQIAVNITRASVDATDNRAFSSAEFKLREDMFTLTELLRRNYDEFKDAYISSSAVQTGIRETRHILARRILKGEELINSETDSDTIAYATHPIDIHLNENGEQLLKSLSRPGPVPFTSMTGAESPNIIAAGRCICADREAFATIRVQGTVMAMGEAAGTAAAMSVNGVNDVRLLNGKELQNRLNFITRESLGL